MVQVSKIVKWFFIVAGTMLATLLALCVFAFWYMSSGIFGMDSFDKQAWHKKQRTNRMPLVITVGWQKIL